MVRGGDGNDRVDGGFGNDALYGGAGNDTFVFSHGNDIVQDFEPGKDHIEVTSTTVHDFSHLGISSNSSGSTVTVGDLGSMFLADVTPTTCTPPTSSSSDRPGATPRQFGLTFRAPEDCRT